MGHGLLKGYGIMHQSHFMQLHPSQLNWEHLFVCWLEVFHHRPHHYKWDFFTFTWRDCLHWIGTGLFWATSWPFSKHIHSKYSCISTKPMCKCIPPPSKLLTTSTKRHGQLSMSLCAGSEISDTILNQTTWYTISLKSLAWKKFKKALRQNL